MKLRVGQGFDVHAFAPPTAGGAAVVLGGVRIPHDQALRAHSDGDVLVHAVCDALLGAAALGDIGHHFPDTDERFRGADSIALLAEAHRRVVQAGWAVGNVDSTIVAQAPKMAPHLLAMRQRIAGALGLKLEQVNVKAKTAEKLGPVGRGEAIEANAICLLYSPRRAPGTM